MDKIINYILIVIIILIIYTFITNIEFFDVNYKDDYKFIPYLGETPKKEINDPSSIMKKCNVIFAGTVRNVEQYIQNTINNIDLCGHQFNNYLLIIYENDSKDNTRKILLDNKKDNYIYIFEDNITEPLRTMRISNGRNKILNKIREINKDNYYDYLIMMDMDDVNMSGKFIESIKSCFEYTGWDILTGNQSGNYYDLWALRKKEDMEYDLWKMIDINKHISNAINIYYYNNIKNYQPGKLLEVDSAFSGIAIYKLSSIPKDCYYHGKYNSGQEHCEHVEFHRCIKKSGKNIYINTSFLTD
jgi:hypothetical protein